MTDLNSQGTQAPERDFDEEHYKLLIGGSVDAWNKWYIPWHNEDPEKNYARLEEADLTRRNLQHADLRGANLRGAQLFQTNLSDANLERGVLTDAKAGHAIFAGAQLVGASMDNALIHNAQFQNADLRRASLTVENMNGAVFKNANLGAACFDGVKAASGVNFSRARAHSATFNDVMFSDCVFEGTLLGRASFENALLVRPNLKNANIGEGTFYDTRCPLADLSGTRFSGTKLQGASFRESVVDGATVLTQCEVDKQTDFSLVGLESARVDPELKQTLHYNIRRQRWQSWYKESWLRRTWSWLVWLFWMMSDYGRSTKRIVLVFFGASVGFAFIYYSSALCSPVGEGMIHNLVYDNPLGLGKQFPCPFLRALYFSVVTMTTLGFGDMHANFTSVSGHILLMIQVMLGYALLGALVTRFAVLFTADGPAAPFSKRKKTTTKANQKISQSTPETNHGN